MKSKKLVTIALLTSGLFIGSTTSALADTAPTSTTSPSAYQTQLAAYKIALTQYRVALVNNDINYRATMAKYWSDWQTTLATFQTANTAFQANLDPIQVTHKSAIDAADAAFLAATTGTPTDDVLNAALTAYWNATKLANTTYKSAVTALVRHPFAQSSQLRL